MASDAQAAEFMSITGAGPDEAKQYLEMAGGSLQDAVNLFMEMGGPSGGAPGQRPAGDAADDDDVRAAIAAFDDQIIDQDAERQRMKAAIAADATEMGRRMAFDRTEDVEQNQVINQLFAPPSFNEKDPFFQVLEKAKTDGKWVLVNIQEPDAFVSHTLNRDVWSDETVADLVVESFFFWQRDNKSMEGEGFCRNYKCGEQLPYICVVDPRTGRNLKSWDGKKWSKPHMASEKIFEFLDRYSVPAPMAPSSAAASTAPAPAAAPPTATAAAAAKGPAPPEEPKSESASGAAAGTAVSREGAAGGEATPAVEAAPAEAAAAEPAEPVAAMPEEPPADAAGLVKVSFRLPSGKRIARRFLASDRVEQVFNVASALSEQPVSTIDISTQFPTRSLRDIENGLEALLSAAQVGGNMLLVETRKRRMLE